MSRPVYIYILKDPESTEVRYVGLTRVPKKRLHNHCHRASTPHFRNWVSSLKGIGKLPVMEIVHTANERNAGELESQWILAYQILGADLLNYTTGGEGGYKMSPETVAKITEKRRSRINKPLSEEHKRNISLALKGRVFSRETLVKAWSNSVAARKGKLLTEEHKRKVSEGVRRAATPEWRAKLSAVHKGRNPYMKTDEIKKRIAEGVRQYHAGLRGSKSGNVRVVNATS